jgi:hypothetical protein
MKAMHLADSVATSLLVEEHVPSTMLTALNLPLQQCCSGRKDPKWPRNL